MKNSLTTPRFRILPYKEYSKSAKLLAVALGGKRIRLENSKYRSRPNDIVINWGNSDYPDFLYSKNINCVPMKSLTNKLGFFQKMQGAEWLPQFWTNAEDIPDEEFPVVARTVLNGHSGVGIVICDSRADLVAAPLYVKYIKKKDEYRLHLARLENNTYKTIAVQQKKRKTDHENPNWQVRNHANGFVYAREGVNPPAGVYDAGYDCLLRSGLDFGAFDVIWNEHEQAAYVLEVNTAPGLEGQTLDDYVNYFKGLV